MLVCQHNLFISFLLTKQIVQSSSVLVFMELFQRHSHLNFHSIDLVWIEFFQHIKFWMLMNGQWTSFQRLHQIVKWLEIAWNILIPTLPVVNQWKGLVILTEQHSYVRTTFIALALSLNPFRENAVIYINYNIQPPWGLNFYCPGCNFVRNSCSELFLTSTVTLRHFVNVSNLVSLNQYW